MYKELLLKYKERSAKLFSPYIKVKDYTASKINVPCPTENTDIKIQQKKNLPTDQNLFSTFRC